MSVRFCSIPGLNGNLAPGAGFYNQGHFLYEFGVYKTYYYREYTVFGNAQLQGTEVSDVASKLKARWYNVYRGKFDFGDYLYTKNNSFSLGDQVVVSFIVVEADVRTAVTGGIDPRTLYMFSNPGCVITSNVFRPSFIDVTHSCGRYELSFNQNVRVKPNYEIRVCILYCMKSNNDFVHASGSNRFSGVCSIYYH